MKKSELFITHIVEVIEKIEKFTDGYTFEEFSTDDKTHEAVIRQLEIIGEAIIHLENRFGEFYPEIPWKDIRGMRNHLIHEYWDINLEDVWQTVIEDIPELKKQITTLKNHKIEQ
jgi:uncharacterized protein with HEPN domain